MDYPDAWSGVPLPLALRRPAASPVTSPSEMQIPALVVETYQNHRYQ